MFYQLKFITPLWNNLDKFLNFQTNVDGLIINPIILLFLTFRCFYSKFRSNNYLYLGIPVYPIYLNLIIKKMREMKKMMVMENNRQKATGLLL